MVLPLAAVSSAAVSASGAYLLAYVLATLLAFAVIAALVQVRGSARARDLAEYRGLLRDHPVLASALALALLSLAVLAVISTGEVTSTPGASPKATLGSANPVPDGAAPVAAHPVRAHPATLVAVGFTAVALVLTSLSPQILVGMLGS